MIKIKKSKSERVYLELPRSIVKVDNTTENYNFFTKNYIPWRNIKSSIYSQKILKREIERTNIVNEFYTNSDTIIKDFVKTVNLASTQL